MSVTYSKFRSRGDCFKVASSDGYIYTKRNQNKGVEYLKCDLREIEIWNLNARVKNDIPRTSNFIEGWHNRFHTFLNVSKPQMWRFLLGLIMEQNRTENRLQIFACTGMLKLQRQKYRDNDKRVKQRIKAYSKALKSNVFNKWIKTMAFYVPDQQKL